MKKILLTIVILMALNLVSRGQELILDFTFDTVCSGGITSFASLARISDTAVIARDSIISISWDLKGDGLFNDGVDSLNSYIYTHGLHNAGLKVITFKGIAKALYKLVPVDSLQPEFTSNAGCLQEPVAFSNHSVVYGDTSVIWSWDFGDGFTIEGVKNPTHSYPDTGVYTVMMTGSFRIGCAQSVSHDISIGGPPQVNFTFSSDTIIRKGDTLIAGVVGNFDRYLWSTGDETSSIEITDAGYYSVQAYRGNCSGQKGFHVIVRERSTIPKISTLFTPNNDGFNDRWERLNLTDVKPSKVNVFNRYGQQVFSSDEYQNNWDGSFNGNRLANDTYYYFVRCLNQELYKGNVNILR